MPDLQLYQPCFLVLQLVFCLYLAFDFAEHLYKYTLYHHQFLLNFQTLQQYVLLQSNRLYLLLVYRALEQLFLHS